ncbi:hypothetical protein [Neisseria yangbaofengii]|uniref:hypothetical protein n=1 Tax=Neisseria yangbaofengii TaxID=2709396 RepID=UPI0013EDFB55|nr:hypothetical protein [Neisseria yangbaofengii]
MFGKIKQYALAALMELKAALSKFQRNEPTWKIPAGYGYLLRHTGKGRNKQPHRFSGVAAAKRAARKRKNKG